MEAILKMDKQAAAVEEGKDIESIYSQLGKVKAKLTAPLMLRHMQPPVYVEFNKGLKVLFFNDTLQVESTLTARYGKYFENDANIYLRDHVVVINKKGERLDCEELNWDSKKEIFYSNKAVRISTVTDTLYGTGLESNQDFSNYTILHPSGPFIIRDSTTTQ
ncbi:LPS export ABC transporter protein LptC [Chitinophaga sp. CF118]|nr:LPS export ABC transporter protein LptC [Chitinophaga sp. CF118]